MSWLDDLLKQTEKHEAPERYFWWSGLAAISAVVRKNVYLEKPELGYTLYPNIYVMLISEKSGSKKGQPVSICKRLLQHTRLARIFSGGDNTMQGIFEKLSMPGDVNGHALKEAQAILIASEFSSFLKDDPKALAHLTDLYDTHAHEEGWEKILKGDGSSKLISPCITMLVASNEPYLFGKSISKVDIEGGFIGRFAYVRESKMRKPNPGTGKPDPEHRLDIPKLSERLLEISKIRGGFEWTPEPKKLYDEWYMDTYNEEIDDRTGTFGRLGDHVLKVAMLISLANKDKLEFDCKDIELAIQRCEHCANDAIKMAQNSEPSNGHNTNYAMRLVLECIAKAEMTGNKISVASILSKLQPHGVYTPQIEICLNNLKAMDWIEKSMVSGDGNIHSRTFYKFTSEGKRQYNNPAMKKR